MGCNYGHADIHLHVVEAADAQYGSSLALFPGSPLAHNYSLSNSHSIIVQKRGGESSVGRKQGILCIAI